MERILRTWGQTTEPTSRPLGNTDFTLASSMNLRRRSGASMRIDAAGTWPPHLGVRCHQAIPFVGCVIKRPFLKRSSGRRESLRCRGVPSVSLESRVECIFAGGLTQRLISAVQPATASRPCSPIGIDCRSISVCPILALPVGFLARPGCFQCGR